MQPLCWPVLLRGICSLPVIDVRRLSSALLSSAVAGTAQSRPRQPLAGGSVEISLWVSRVLDRFHLQGSHFWAGTSWTVWYCQCWLSQLLSRKYYHHHHRRRRPLFTSLNSFHYNRWICYLCFCSLASQWQLWIHHFYLSLLFTSF